MWRRPSAASVVVLIAAVALGAATGLGGFTFIYAKGASYLTEDPIACANCHVMRNEYDAWMRSSHRAVAVCNDCHTPAGFISKYAAKASNGYHHSLAFTTGSFAEPIKIKEHNRAVTESRCRGCHEAVVHQIDAHAGFEPISCIRCHSSVGHLH